MPPAEVAECREVSNGEPLKAWNYCCFLDARKSFAARNLDCKTLMCRVMRIAHPWADMENRSANIEYPHAGIENRGVEIERRGGGIEQRHGAVENRATGIVQPRRNVGFCAGATAFPRPAPEQGRSRMEPPEARIGAPGEDSESRRVFSVGVDVPAGALGPVAVFDRGGVAGVDVGGGFRLAAGAGAEGGEGGEGKGGEEESGHGAHGSGERRRVEGNRRRRAAEGRWKRGLRGAGNRGS